MKKSEKRIEKVFQLDIDKKDTKWGKGYREIVVCETDSNIWTYEDNYIEMEVGFDGTLTIRTGNYDNWVYIKKSMLPLLKEAIEIMENE